MIAGNRYRADIDGLRAIAVGLVIFYHLRPAALPSGYLGVDIFFVISGYVVASSALAKVTGRPLKDIWQFWLRRIRRIVPPLVIVVAAGAVAAAAVFPPYPPVNYDIIFRTGAASLFGLSNLYLDRTATDYFLVDTATLNPFLHTWSLGVEEQYYIFFAVVCIGLGSLVRQEQARSKLLIWVLATIVGGSVLLALTSSLPALSKFYLPQTRIWEIGLGSLAAVLGTKRDLGVRWPRTVTGVRLGMLFALLALATLPHAAGLYPASSVFLACLATVVLVSLAPAHMRAEPLRWAPVVYIGLISYGLYLWHWVVLFILQVTVGTTSVLALILAIGAPLALSALSYRFLEQRFRDRRQMSDRRVVVAAVIALISTVGLLATIQQLPGHFYAGKARDWNGRWMPPPDHAYAPGGKITKLGCHLGGAAPTAIPDACIARHDASRPARTILSVGDSHAFSDWSMLSAVYARGWDWAALSKDGCTLSLGDPDCVAFWDAVPNYAGAVLKPGDVLYVSVNWHGSKSDKDYETLDRLASATAARGITLAIKTSLPFIPRPSFLCTKEWFRTDYEGCSVPRDRELARIAKRSAALQTFAGARPNVRLFDPFDALCPATPCKALRDDQPLFRDSRHLSVSGSRSLAPSFVALLEKR